jgi:hypothetical protein
MTRQLKLAFPLMLLAGCAGTVDQPLGTSQADQIAGRSLVVVAHERPTFVAATARKAMFGAFGAMAMAGEGDAIVTRNGIEDPAVYIGEEIAKSLAARYDVATDGTTGLSDTDDLDRLARQYGGSDLILFTQTRGWSFMYFPTDWDNYRISLNVTVKLFDPKRKSVLAAADCAYAPEHADSDEAPTQDELLADNARGLKAELQKGADHCLQKFLRDTFA